MRYHAAQGLAVGAVRLRVCGAHMLGLPLNGELLRLDARFLGPARTAPLALYCLDSFAPPRPGLLRQEPGGAIAVEVWELPIAAFGTLVAGNSRPARNRAGRARGGGDDVTGFLCEAHATEGADDITAHGGWRGYLAAGGGL